MDLELKTEMKITESQTNFHENRVTPTPDPSYFEILLCPGAMKLRESAQANTESDIFYF